MRGVSALAFLAGCILVPASPVFGECVGYGSTLKRCMDEVAAKRAACTDSDYRCNEAKIYGEQDCRTADDRRADRSRGWKIPARARDTIWAGYPEMQEAIDLINRGAFIGLTTYALFPDQGYSDPRNIPTSVKKIRRSEMRTPEYWLLLRLYGYTELSANGWLGWISEYSYKGGDRGIPILPSGTGVSYFAKGLAYASKTQGRGYGRGYREETVIIPSPDAEADLLKALYMGARGAPEGADAIVNGSYLGMPTVRTRVMQLLRGEGKPGGREESYKLAYLYETLCPQCGPGVYQADFHTEDRALVKLAAGALSSIVGTPYQTLYENLAGSDCEFPVSLGGRR